MKNLFLAFSLAAVFSTCACADEPKTLKAITAPNYAPYEFLDNGELKGYDVDIMNEIAKRSGYKLEYKYMDFDGLIPTLKSGKADVIAALMKKTPLRAKSIDFTKEFKHSSNILLINSNKDLSLDNLKPCDNADFNGKKVGVEMGTVQYDLAKGYGINPTGFSEAGIAIFALLKNKLDAVFIDRSAAIAFSKKNPELKPLCEQTDNDGQGFGVTKGSPLLAEFDKAITSMIEDGTIEKLNQKWGI